MEPQSFSWRSFDQTARALQSLGYLVIVFGPLAGVAMLIMGDFVMRMIGVAVIVASVLVALYHISFSLLMNALHDLAAQIERARTSANA